MKENILRDEKHTKLCLLKIMRKADKAHVLFLQLPVLGTLK